MCERDPRDAAAEGDRDLAARLQPVSGRDPDPDERREGRDIPNRRGNAASVL